MPQSGDTVRLEIDAMDALENAVVDTPSMDCAAGGETQPGTVARS